MVRVMVSNGFKCRPNVAFYWLVVMHTYLYCFPLSLNCSLVSIGCPDFYNDIIRSLFTTAMLEVCYVAAVKRRKHMHVCLETVVCDIIHQSKTDC